jgi:hypothetical protein
MTDQNLNNPHSQNEPTIVIDSLEFGAKADGPPDTRSSSLECSQAPIDAPGRGSARLELIPETEHVNCEFGDVLQNSFRAMPGADVIPLADDLIRINEMTKAPLEGLLGQYGVDAANQSNFGSQD